jgi:hypothetical protein
MKLINFFILLKGKFFPKIVLENCAFFGLDKEPALEPEPEP